MVKRADLMSNVVHCDCGAKFRVPAPLTDRALRCPKCKNGVAVAVDGVVLAPFRPQRASAAPTCAICQTAITADATAVKCPDCSQVYHRDCWAEVGGCGTYGCPQAPAAQTKTVAANAPRHGWGDEKACPTCGEQIKSMALKCRYCGATFDTVDPLTLADLHRQVDVEEQTATLKKIVIALFVASLTGCLAPIAGIVGAAILLPKRQTLHKAGPMYQVLGYASLLLSAMYSILLLCFALFS
jgi:hypothetical protein